MRKKWQRVLLVTCVVALAGPLILVGAAMADDDEVDLRAQMTGAQEVPAADPDGTGKADVELFIVGGQVCFEIEFDDIGTPNRAHIHRAPAGVNGPIVVPFFDIQNATDQRDPRHDELEMGKFSSCVTSTPALLAEIAANPEAFYVNFHNARFPGGAVRGQLMHH
jgi:hypothetical protein